MLILATESSTKCEILTRSGLEFQAIGAEVNEREIENAHADLDARETAILLARSKADILAKKYPDACILAADTFGVLPDGSRLHKAKTADETVKMCLSQSGKTTTVYTGVCVVYRGKTLTDSTTTRIKYVDFDLATLKAVSEKIASNRRNASLGFHVDAPGFALVERIEGSYTGALGLPLDKVFKLLRQSGYDESRSNMDSESSGNFLTGEISFYTSQIPLWERGKICLKLSFAKTFLGISMMCQLMN